MSPYLHNILLTYVHADPVRACAGPLHGQQYSINPSQQHPVRCVRNALLPSPWMTVTTSLDWCPVSGILIASFCKFLRRLRFRFESLSQECLFGMAMYYPSNRASGCAERTAREGVTDKTAVPVSPLSVAVSPFVTFCFYRFHRL